MAVPAVDPFLNNKDSCVFMVVIVYVFSFNVLVHQEEMSFS